VLRESICRGHTVEFEWDAYKAEDNLTKHGVSFDEAATVFNDDWRVTIFDEEHSWEEDRFFTLGRSDRDNLLAVAWTMSGDAFRIISARPARPAERRVYDEQD
jgi:hypothetical protein